MINDCPCPTRDLIDKWLASASSARLTRSFRAIVESVSPRLTVYKFSATKSSGEAEASRLENCPPVPVGTFTSYSG